MQSTTFRAFAFAAIALGTLALASPAFAASTTTTTPRTKALNAYRSCMKKHGVTLPTFNRPPGGFGAGGGGGAGGSATGGSGGLTPPSTGGSGSAGSNSSGGTGNGGRGFGNFVPRNLPKGVTLKKYQAAQKACQSKLPKGGFGFGARNTPQFQAYLSCLRDHGVTVPTNGGLRNLDRTSSTFQAANQVCGVLLPNGGRPGPNGAPPTTGTST